jgi:hypothetical protein
LINGGRGKRWQPPRPTLWRRFHPGFPWSLIERGNAAGFAGRHRPACGKIRYIPIVDRNSPLP